MILMVALSLRRRWRAARLGDDSNEPLVVRYRYSVKLQPIAVLLIAAGLSSPPARATTLTVPDEAATIQAALDAGVDTVIVGPGIYAETPIVSRPVTLMAVSTAIADAPTVTGVRLLIGPTDLYPALFAFQGIHVNGGVVIVNDRALCDISFAQCELRGGVVDSSRHLDTGDISISKCRVGGFSKLAARGTISFDSCQVSGHVLACGGSPSFVVSGCVFEGDGTGYGIGSCSISGSRVEGNTVRRYATGVSVNGDAAVVVNNVIEDCTWRGLEVETSDATVENNLIRRCGDGIIASSWNSMVAVRNIIAGAGGIGLHIVFDSQVEVSRNVVWGCGSDGLKFEGSFRSHIKVEQNTSALNGGSGFVSENVYETGVSEWIGNIGYGNGQYGLCWVTPDLATLTCNDWFANRAGTVQGPPPSSEDFSVDPQFCAAEGGDFSVNSTSPILGWSGCGQIGAMGVGCGVTATLVQRFVACRMSDGIRVIWEVADGATASDVWLERWEASSGQGWRRPATERSLVSRAIVELDRHASLDRAYSYRLVALENGEAMVIGQPIVVEAQARLDSRLVRVGPNPSDDPVRIVFVLKDAAAIQIDVFDLQGRRVASPGRGLWPAGTHDVVWDGRTRNSEPAPAGMYIVRYLYPGGQDRRGIVRVQ